MPYRVVFSPDASNHFDDLSKYQQTTIVEAIETHLIDQPQIETRNRKPLRPNPLAPWELRIGDLRVFYDVAEQPEQFVTILAIGIKKRQQLIIGGEVVEL